MSINLLSIVYTFPPGGHIKSHKFIKNYYGGNGSFGVEYELVVEYKDKQFIINNTSYTHNGFLMTIYSGIKMDDSYDVTFQFENPIIFNKISNFFHMGEYCYDKNDEC